MTKTVKVLRWFELKRRNASVILNGLGFTVGITSILNIKPHIPTEDQPVVRGSHEVTTALFVSAGCVIAIFKVGRHSLTGIILQCGWFYANAPRSCNKW